MKLFRVHPFPPLPPPLFRFRVLSATIHTTGKGFTPSYRAESDTVDLGFKICHHVKRARSTQMAFQNRRASLEIFYKRNMFRSGYVDAYLIHSTVKRSAGRTDGRTDEQTFFFFFFCNIFLSNEIIRPSLEQFSKMKKYAFAIIVLPMVARVHMCSEHRHHGLKRCRIYMLPHVASTSEGDVTLVFSTCCSFCQKIYLHAEGRVTPAESGWCRSVKIRTSLVGMTRPGRQNPRHAPPPTL